MKSLCSLLLAALALCALSPAGWCTGFLVIPGGEATSDGDAANLNPFFTDGMAYQQVYGAAEFGLSPLTLTAVAFRLDHLTGSSFTLSIDDLQVSLSTTARGVDALSANQFLNRGGDNTLVYDQALAWSAGVTAANPEPFSLVIPFATPFLFDPAKGNLLLSIIVNGKVSVPSYTYLDAVSSESDAVSRNYNGALDSLGLVTQFSSPDVPEPGCALLITALGGGLLGFRRLRR